MDFFVDSWNGRFGFFVGLMIVQWGVFHLSSLIVNYSFATSVIFSATPFQFPSPLSHKTSQTPYQSDFSFSTLCPNK
jgi:hypothetical protein